MCVLVHITSPELGAYLANQGMAVVYGGGQFGLMGKLANSVLKNGGKLTGYIPKFFTGIWLSLNHP